MSKKCTSGESFLCLLLLEKCIERVAERVEPQPAAVLAYNEGYRILRKLYPALRTLRDN
ncbi:MAG TPA: hypothetical protein VGD64_06840 [Acidisarcina sp.]